MNKQQNSRLSQLEFDFSKTVRMLQRGKNDPINIINGRGEWRRCFYFANAANLLSTSYNKSSQQTTTKILHGNIRPADAMDLIAYTLGFDDPFLTTQINALPFADKLRDAIGLNIPGYPDLFEAIIQVIMGQQISVAVANSLRTKFTLELGDKVIYRNINYACFPHPQQVIAQSSDKLRTLGLSANKCKSVLTVAKAFIENKDILQFTIKTDPVHVRQVLTNLYGVGNWTVDWLLMRHFRRFEVVPEGDIAVQKAISWWLNRENVMTVADIKHLEKEFYPFGGSVAFRVLYAYSNQINRQQDA